MKIIINESQLRRLIKEFQDIYDNGIDQLSKEIKNEIETGGFKMGSNKNGEYVIDDDWAERREKESFRLLNIMKEKIIIFLTDYFNLSEGKVYNKVNELINKLFVLSINDDIEYRHQDTSDWHIYWIAKPNTGVYSFKSNDFKNAINHLMKIIESLLDNKQKKELSSKIELSKTKYAPSYSGEKIQDDLSKQIYDWEYTKNILENLFNEYIHNEEYVNEELFNKINDSRVFGEMMDIMDKDMKDNEYKIFEPIRNNNWREDFKGFVKSYITYYGEKLNNEQQFRENIKVGKKLPPEVFFGRLLWDMTYWIK